MDLKELLNEEAAGMRGERLTVPADLSWLQILDRQGFSSAEEDGEECSGHLGPLVV